MLSIIVNHLELGMELSDAVAKPRFHHQWLPNELLVETNMPKEICKKLEQRGHKIKTTKHLAVSQSIAISADGVFIGIHDPRIQVKQQGTEIAWIEELINR